MASRREEREYALKIAFAHRFNNEDLDEIIKKLLETDEYAKDAITDFVKRLVSLSAAQKEELDEIIKPRLNDWDLDRIPKMDHIILRVSISEMKFFPEIPASVIINEYLELTRMFSSEKSRKFINGVLDSVARDLRG